MGDLVGLPGVKGGKIKNVKFASTVGGAMRVLRVERAVTGAGDHGAWTVWKDDDGKVRCTFQRHHVTINEVICTTKKQVGAWLREWIPMADARGVAGSKP